MSFKLSPLPFAYDALAPHMSESTLRFHHDKHHQKYVDTLNELVTGTKLESASLESIIRETADKAGASKIFNNAAQVWNHDFFWKSLSPKGGGEPGGEVAVMIKKSFGGTDEFAKTFKAAATGQFGSGWAWLVLDKGALTISTTGNADLPLAHGRTALLTLDVWEHAYYLDVQNRRPDYVETFLKHLVNWDFANQNLSRAKASASS